MVGMGWVLIMRYYLIEKQRRKATIVSLKEDISQQHDGALANTSVPWLALFSQAPFWYAHCIQP